MTPRELLKETVLLYRDQGIPDPESDAALLLSWLTGRDPLSLRLDMDTSLSPEILDRFRFHRQKRLERIPLQHLTCEQSFNGHLYRVNASVLIPRPETAELVEAVLSRIETLSSPSILDLCSGSGCIGIELALARQDASVTGSDLSAPALDVARENAESLGAPVTYVQGDLFSALTGRRFDVIVSNPPYIPTEDCRCLQPEVLREPLLALDGGSDGLDFYRRICSEARAHLNGNGLLAFETGFDQTESVAALLRDAGFEQIEILRDMSHLPRMVLARWGREV